MSKRDQTEGGLGQHKVYVRKPGPRSEEPHTAEEWRTLLDRCVRARREHLLDSVRAIVLGRVEESSTDRAAVGLEDFMSSSRERWMKLVQVGPENAPFRFPNGHYEIAIGLVNPQPAAGLAELKDRLGVAQRVQTSGWPPFLDIGIEGLNPYAYESCIEAWLGRPTQRNTLSGPLDADFWRASLSGQLYLIRGYGEDSAEGRSSSRRIPGEFLTIDLSVIRIWECLRIANQFARTFEDVDGMIVQCLYTGLSGRRLIHSSRPALSIREGVSEVGEVPLYGQFTLQQLEDNMPEVLQHLMAPLFEQFNFFKLTLNHVQNVLARYRQMWPY